MVYLQDEFNSTKIFMQNFHNTFYIPLACYSPVLLMAKVSDCPCMSVNADIQSKLCKLGSQTLLPAGFVNDSVLRICKVLLSGNLKQLCKQSWWAQQQQQQQKISSFTADMNKVCSNNNSDNCPALLEAKYWPPIAAV